MLLWMLPPQSVRYPERPPTSLEAGPCTPGALDFGHPHPRAAGYSVFGSACDTARLWTASLRGRPTGTILQYASRALQSRRCHSLGPPECQPGIAECGGGLHKQRSDGTAQPAATTTQRELFTGWQKYSL